VHFVFLKSIVLHGFKSFAQREELLFTPGISAIVGPNGCGKSNIIDAVRWVLGEQNIKNLRGSSLQDVIFAGTQDRKPLGMAEVTLVLDNTDKAIPYDFAEISITRRTYRSGESEFFINNIPCRLKDIQELFMDTGLGRGSISIIGQGEITAIISSRPEAKRELLEEAAGISKYKHKRKDALDRLQDTIANLARVEDIIAEVQSQMGPLKQEMERAKEYKSLLEELVGVEKILLIDEWRKHRISDLKLSSQIETVLSELDKVNEEFRQLEESIVDKQKDMDEISAKVDYLKSVINQWKETLNINQSRIEVLKERSRGYQADQQRREVQLTALENEIIQLEQQAETLNQTFTRLEEQIKEVSESAKAAEDELTKLKDDILKKEKGLDGLQKEHLILLQQIAGAQSVLGRATGNKEAALALVNREQNEIKTLIESQQKQQTEQDHLSQEIQDLNQNKKAIQKKLGELREHLKQVQIEERHLIEKRDAHWLKLKEITSKKEALLGIINSYEGFADGVVACVKAMESWSSQVIGPLGSLLQVESGYELALEAALGGATQHVLVENEQVAFEALTYLKNHQAGKVTFFPLNGTASINKKDYTHIDDYIPALSVVKYNTDIQNAVTHYLGKVLIAPTIEECQKARLKYGDCLCVSMEGDLITPQGQIAGGKAKDSPENSILSRKRRLSDLDKTVKEAQNQAKQFESLVQEMSRLRKESENELVGVEKEFGYTIRELQEKEKRHQLGKDRFLALTRAIEERNAALAKAQRELTQAEQDMHTAQKTAEENERKRQQIEVQLQGQSKELNEAKAMLDLASQGHSSTKTELAGLSSEKKEVQRHIELIKQRMVRLKEEKQQETSGINEAKNRIEQTQQEITACTLQVESASEKILLTEKELSSLLLIIQNHKQEAASLNETAKNVAQQVSQHNDTLHKLELKREREAASLEQIGARLQERNISVPIDPESIEPVKRVGELTDRVAVLKQSLTDLGDVNLLAIDDYQSAQNRYDFLCEQRNDLLQAKEGLDKAILEMDAESTQRLQKTFESVQQAILTIFPRLFTGGKCELSWTDPDNILSSGIEMIVQPPGKRPQPLLTLSGGEQALSAIALLFSLMMVRPAPFFILDEIEAALDGANLSRFVLLLKEFGKNNQIIIVTHRQQSMESADVLYGVTTERYGSSRLFSIDLQSVASGQYSN
jgi:chromosome segregation protein